MTDPTFFTVIADFKSVVVDLITDPDTDPQLGPVTAKVTFTPIFTGNGNVILAADAAPRPTGYIPAPIVGRIDADGRLKLRVEPDGDRDDYSSVSNFPAVGKPSKVYFAVNTQTFYRWNGSTYVTTYPYTPVRLLADTALLQLPNNLYYQVSFSDVVFNGKPGYIRPFTFQAASDDYEINLIDVMPGPSQPFGAGANAPMLAGAEFDENDDLVFINADQSELSPIEIPVGTLVLIDNSDSTWSVL